MKRFILAAIALSVAVSGTLAHGYNAAKIVKGLVSHSGMTIYTCDMDVSGSGRSECNGSCVGPWSPVVATADAKPEGGLSPITRNDGTREWAYKGKPVYTYAADKIPVDVAGNNFKGVWHVINDRRSRQTQFA